MMRCGNYYKVKLWRTMCRYSWVYSIELNINESFLLNIWWNAKEIINEVFHRTKWSMQTIYCQQSDRLWAKLPSKWAAIIKHEGVLFHHNKARPHIALMLRRKFHVLIGKFCFTRHLVSILHLQFIHFFIDTYFLHSSIFQYYRDCKNGVTKVFWF